VLGICSEGVGAPEFAAKLAQLSSFREYLDEIENTAVEVDQWQLEKLALVGQKYDLLFYTPGVSPDSAGALASRMFDDPSTALKKLVSGLPVGAHVAVIPEGPYVFAQVEQSPLP
jgi:lactate racemase